MRGRISSATVEQAHVTTANAWARAMVTQYWQSNRSGLHTVADVLAWLDNTADVPAAWAHWQRSSAYQTRYQMVRNACITLAREGYLQTSSTMNAKNRESVAYHYAGATDTWSIHVEPASQSERVSGLLRSWLHAHRHELAGVETLTLELRKPLSRHGSNRAARGTEDHGPAVHLRKRLA